MKKVTRNKRVESLEKQVHCLLLDAQLSKEDIRSLEQTVGDLIDANTDLHIANNAQKKVIRMLENDAKSVLNRVKRKKK